MSTDLARLEARIRERERAIQSGDLRAEELEALLAESVQLELELLSVRGRLAPQLQQITSLLLQLRSTRRVDAPRLDVQA